MSVLLKWDNAESFKRHLEEMRLFRRSHRAESPIRANFLNHLPRLYIHQPTKEMGGTSHSVGEEGWPCLIPIQRVAPDAFSRN